MTERIIPIQIENDGDNSDESNCDENVPKSEDIKQQTSKPVVRVKLASDVQEEYLKKYDKFTERTLLSKYSLPNADVKEKIVLVIDRGQDEDFTPFVTNNMRYSPLAMLKQALSIFINLKHTVNKFHEFAVIVMNENDATLLLNFSSDVRKLKDVINKIEECEIEDIFDFKSVFNIVKDLAKIPEPFVEDLPPPYVIRVIVLYSRSITIPKLTNREEIEEYLSHPYFTCDILMTHEPVESSNNCNKIFSILQNLDNKGIAYFFPVCRDAKRLHKSVAKLLAHPLQRPIQKLVKI